MADPNTRQELNRLYWESDASVSEIADTLDISRRALYDGIEPQPADGRCPECGAPLVYRNRTALENREATCPDCGYETELEAGATDGAPETAPEPADDRTDRRALPELEPAPAMGAAFVAGLALGALVARLIQRS